MPITWRLEITFECDQCGGNLILDQMDTLKKTAPAIRRALIGAGYQDGWKNINGKLLCPECLKK